MSGYIYIKDYQAQKQLWELQTKDLMEPGQLC